MDKQQHFELLRDSAVKVKELQEQLQHIRNREAELKARRGKVLEELRVARDVRVNALEELTAARDLRVQRMTAAIDDNVPKAQIARELGMDRTNLYKLLNDFEPDTQ
ncbi:hypothetical protein [Actinocrispum wychmicini]|uniref:Homeodomain-like domain-containing protein n=1 Tax=Actinocrispum wychmicini TaxID=1213861 RepID=A0A4R2J999_9PSEU|nr:hypothetical protein [Actinocrispum wychmicini]TCO55883.1 hypothetical protein EV192_107306 [Actinocrispum wychmicini]